MAQATRRSHSTAKSRSTSADPTLNRPASRTARSGETEVQARARHDRIAAEKRAGSKEPAAAPPRSARGKAGDELGVDLDTTAFRVTERGIEPGRDDRTERQHRANPEKAGDTSIRHAEPPTGKLAQEGAGGYPAGEYDVIQPAKGVATQPKSPQLAALEAHFADYDLQERIARVRKDARINERSILYGAEALPPGAVIEHEGLERWRVKLAVAGVNRYGHGRTMTEAIEAFILGDRPVTEPTEEMKSKAGKPGTKEDSSGAAEASARDIAGRKRGVERGNEGAKAVLEDTEIQTEERAKAGQKKVTRRSAGSKKAKRSGKKAR